MRYGIYTKLSYWLDQPGCTKNVKSNLITSSIPWRITFRPTSSQSNSGLEDGNIPANIAVGESTGFRPDTTRLRYQPYSMRSVRIPGAFLNNVFEINSGVHAVATRLLI